MSLPTLVPETSELVDGTRESLGTARDWLLAAQDPSGYWRGELETNVTMDAEDLMLRTFLGNLKNEDATAAARWIRSNQREDGTWANYYGGPGDLSTTVEAYFALRLAGDEPSEPHMQRAASFVREAGGLETSRVFTRFWLALFGLWPWEDLPCVPPELIFVPPSVPLNIYDFGCWARQTVVAISIVFAYRPVHEIGFGLEELRANRAHERPARSLFTWRGRFLLLDDLLHRYDALARKGLLRKTVREFALSRAERWVLTRQEGDGGWGGIQPPWVYSILALHLRGYRLDHPVMTKTFEGLESFLVRRDGLRWLEACQSPVWDTALAAIALADAELSPEHESLQRAASWLLDQEIRVTGDWAIKKPNLAPGGWAFEFANLNYPDVDDTAEVLLALRRITAPNDARVEGALERGLAWTSGMVCANGAWGAFDADNLREVLYELPFCDFGAVIDPPSADVTADVLEMLATDKRADPLLIERGRDWLIAEQEADGSWYGRWGVNYIYGTGAVVPALIAIGMSADDPVIERGIAFLESHQNLDGGWGEDIASYVDQGLAGQGTSTPSQTAWALLAFIAVGRADSAARAGVSFLVQSQRESGTWDEPQYTGTGFPRFFYINYHLYRHVFPLSALGRWCSASRVGPGEEN